ncbi:MAG: protease modulator HflC [Caulobacterales bacterium]
MMRRISGAAIAVGLGLAIVGANTMFVVSETQQALVLQLGQAVHVINATKHEPGLKLKMPLTQNVIKYDKRNLALDIEPREIVCADQERLVVDAVARWRIQDPLKFYQAFQTEDQAEDQLPRFLTAGLQRVLSSVKSDEIISGQRAEQMVRIRDETNAQLKPFGVLILDVRILRADLPQANLARVFERMAADRKRAATEIRGNGEARAREIRATADRDATVIKADAQEQAERLRGEGDGKAGQIYNRAYGRDPEFASFYRSMRAYETSIQSGAPMVLSPDSDFFKYFKTERGGR